MVFRTFHKRPVYVEAVRWWGPFIGDGKQGPTVADLESWGCLVTPTRHWGMACGEEGCQNNGNVTVHGGGGLLPICYPGDWIVKLIDAGDVFWIFSDEEFRRGYLASDGRDF